jgi:hypothetical protein
LYFVQFGCLRESCVSLYVFAPKSLGESSTINSIVVSSKHPNAELFVKTAFIVWEVLEKLAETDS